MLEVDGATFFGLKFLLLTRKEWLFIENYDPEPKSSISLYCFEPFIYYKI